MVVEVSGPRGKNYLKREHLLGLGAVSVEYITELVHRRPRTWPRDIDKMHELLSFHGADAVRVAITHALQSQTYGAEYVAHHLARLVFVGEVQQ